MKTFESKLGVLAVSGLLLAITPAGFSREGPGPPDWLRQLDQGFADVAQKASETVVVINVVQKAAPVQSDEEDDSFPPGFWQRFHEQLRRPEPSLGQGSGVIIRPNGYILTNGHVIEDAESIEVRLKDGRKFAAVVRGVDPQSDLAVLKIEAQSLPVATFADSDKTRVGEFAIAVGTPFSLDYTVTFGHVSAKGRSNVLDGYEGAMMDQEFMQTDALINPGNSGGPLVNIEGQVIGINTLIRGLHTGIGFAVPSNLAREVSDQIVATGKFTRAWLGIAIAALRDDTDLRDLVRGVAEGVVVSGILPEGPAAKSDLKAGDIITAVDGRPVGTPQQLKGQIRDKKIGQPVVLSVFRKTGSVRVEVSPGEWVQPTMAVAKTPSAPAASGPPPAFGVTVQPVTADIADRLRVPAGEGVLVASVEKSSPAARKGIQAGDIITSIDEQPVNDPKQFNAALKKADIQRGILVNFISKSTPQFTVIKAQP